VGAALHAQLIARAKAEGVSLNTLIASTRRRRQHSEAPNNVEAMIVAIFRRVSSIWTARAIARAGRAK
jgi:hypothetical protein